MNSSPPPTRVILYKYVRIVTFNKRWLGGGRGREAQGTLFVKLTRAKRRAEGTTRGRSITSFSQPTLINGLIISGPAFSKTKGTIWKRESQRSDTSVVGVDRERERGRVNSESKFKSSLTFLGLTNLPRRPLRTISAADMLGGKRILASDFFFPFVEEDSGGLGAPPPDLVRDTCACAPADNLLEAIGGESEARLLPPPSATGDAAADDVVRSSDASRITAPPKFNGLYFMIFSRDGTKYAS